MKEFIQNIYSTSTERIKNPFVGSYMLAFIVINWRAFLHLFFSNTSIEAKIDTINTKYCDAGSILWPLAISIIYILVIPYLNLLFDMLLTISNNRNQERSDSNIISKLTTDKIVAKLEREVAEERAGTGEITDLKNQIENLTAENQNLTQQNQNTFEKYNDALVANNRTKQVWEADKQSQTKIISELTDEKKSLQEEILSTNNKISELNSNFDKLKNSNAELEITYDDAEFLLEKIFPFTNDEKKYFIEYGKYKDDPRNGMIAVLPKVIKKFNAYNLVSLPDEDNSTPMLTNRGKTIYRDFQDSWIKFPDYDYKKML